MEILMVKSDPMIAARFVGIKYNFTKINIKMLACLYCSGNMRLVVIT